MSTKSRRPVKKENEPRKSSIPSTAAETRSSEMRRGIDAILEDCDPTNLMGLEWLASNNRYISAEELAIVIEANPGTALPEGLRGYLCRFLRGKIKQKRGPKGIDAKINFAMEFVAAEEYRILLKELQAKRKFRGREAIGKGVPSPHDEAITIIKERFKVRFGSVSPERVANIISSHDK